MRKLILDSYPLIPLHYRTALHNVRDPDARLWSCNVDF